MDKKEAVHGLAAVWSYITADGIAFAEKLLVIGFVLAYIISPIDLIPDFPVIGWLDDVGIGAFFIAYCNHRIKGLQETEEKKKKEAAQAESEVIDVTAEAHAQSHEEPKSTFSFTRKG